MTSQDSEDKNYPKIKERLSASPNIFQSQPYDRE